VIKPYLLILCTSLGLVSCGGGSSSSSETTSNSLEVTVEGLASSIELTLSRSGASDSVTVIRDASARTLLNNLTVGSSVELRITGQPDSSEICQLRLASKTLVVAAGVNRLSLQCFATGQVSLFAGSGTAGSADGSGAAAEFWSPKGAAFGPDGTLYVADANNFTIRTVSPLGAVGTVTANPVGGESPLGAVSGVRVTADGTIFFTETDTAAVRKIQPDGTLVTIAGGSGRGPALDGLGAAAVFDSPGDLVVDSAAGYIYVSDTGNHLIRRVTIATGQVTTFAGTGSSGFTDGAAIAAQFNQPFGMAMDAWGNLYVADLLNGAIRKIRSDGQVSTYFGPNSTGWHDGTDRPESGGMAAPNRLIFDASGNLYVSETHLIRKITPAGVSIYMAGLEAGRGGDVAGNGVSARFNNPRGLAVDTSGVLYVVDASNHRVKKMVLP
jgi:DNA-binding beta-propeller fold protein YncE